MWPSRNFECIGEFIEPTFDVLNQVPIGRYLAGDCEFACGQGRVQRLQVLPRTVDERLLFDRVQHMAQQIHGFRCPIAPQ